MYPATPGTRARTEPGLWEFLLTRAEWGKQRATVTLQCPGPGHTPRQPHYSFFFSFCLRSLFISLLAIPMYFRMIPCWFSPGSNSTNVTRNEKKKKMKLRRQYLTLWRWLQLNVGGLWRSDTKAIQQDSAQNCSQGASWRCTHAHTTVPSISLLFAHDLPGFNELQENRDQSF